MKNVIRISVKKPCSEKFENFSKTASGGFCDSCQKEVINFTAMTSEELINHFSNNSGKTCGRFTSSQLKTYNPIMNNKSNKRFISRGLAVMSLSILSLCAVSNLRAQTSTNPNTVLSTEIVMGAPSIQEDEYTVKGIVLDQYDTALFGVNVVVKNSTEGIVTNEEGKFKFPRPLKVGEVLVFSYIGYQPKEYKVIANESGLIELSIAFQASDISLMGAVEVEGVYESKPNIFQRFLALFN